MGRSVEESTDAIVAGIESFHERLVKLEKRDPRGAVIEIIEYSNEPNEVGVIVPNSVSINGQELLTSADHPVTVHEVQMPGHGAVLVTLTLFARRVVVEQRNN